MIFLGTLECLHVCHTQVVDHNSKLSLMVRVFQAPALPGRSCDDQSVLFLAHTQRWSNDTIIVTFAIRANTSLSTEPVADGFVLRIQTA